MKNKRIAGSITLEACIVMPIFIGLMLFLYGIMIFFAGQAIVEDAMVQAVESLSLDPISTETLGDGTIDSGKSLVSAMFSVVIADDDNFYSNSKWYSDNSDKLEDVAKKRFEGFLVGNSNTSADELLSTFKIADGIDGISFAGSSVSDGVLTLKLTYGQYFWCNVNGFPPIERELVLKVKLWGV